MNKFIPATILALFISFTGAVNAADDPASTSTSTSPSSAETQMNSSQRDSKYDGIELSVNINTASADEIAVMLKGIGSKKAQQIVDYREAHGNFATIDDLQNVKGIGAATVAKNKTRIEL